MPPPLAVIGAGPLVCELASFRPSRLARHTLNLQSLIPFAVCARKLDASAIVCPALERDGAALRLTDQIQLIQLTARGTRTIHARRDRSIEAMRSWRCCPMRRTSNRLGLQEAQVAFDRKDGHHRQRSFANEATAASSRPAMSVRASIHCMPPTPSTHRLAGRSSSIAERRRSCCAGDPVVLPITDPEIAHVGLNEKGGTGAGHAIAKLRQEFPAATSIAPSRRRPHRLREMPCAAGTDLPRSASDLVGVTTPRDDRRGDDWLLPAISADDPGEHDSRTRRPAKRSRRLAMRTTKRAGRPYGAVVVLTRVFEDGMNVSILAIIDGPTTPISSSGYRDSITLCGCLLEVLALS